MSTATKGKLHGFPARGQGGGMSRVDDLVRRIQGPRCVRFEFGGAEHVLNFDEAATLVRRIEHAIAEARDELAAHVPPPPPSDPFDALRSQVPGRLPR